MKQLLQKYSISIAIVTVFVLILVGACLSYYNNQVMKNALLMKEQAEMIIKATDNTITVIREMDISARGYAIIQEDRFLFLAPEVAKERNIKNFRTLDSLLTLQGYSDPKNYSTFRKGFDTYVEMYAQMVRHLKNNEHEEYKALLYEDYGNVFWATIEAFNKNLYTFQKQQNEKAQLAYDAAVLRNGIIQLLLVIIGLPTLGLALHTMRSDARQREQLLKNVKENNQKYLFNDGENGNITNAEEILGNSITNLKKAADFVTQISEGNYEVHWEQLNESNAALNQSNLAGRLIIMREQMKKIKLEDQKRLWATEGLSKFSELIRNHQQNIGALAYEAVVFVVKYLKAQQGALFVVNNEDEKNRFIELKACYAFNRKKYLTKKIEIGEGMIGQAYLEAQTTVLTEVPEGYTTITSGLGDATPGTLLIIPMKYNDEVQAILEVASFKVYEPYEIEFLERIGEFVASAVTTAKTNEMTSKLLADAQRMAEEMRAQEEEMRQNMEELSATQEEMIRKEQRYLKTIQQLETTRES